MPSQARAILWAQYLTLRNFYSKGNTGALIFTLIMSALWYGTVAVGAVFIGIFLADPTKLEVARRFLPAGLLLTFFYWQVIPIILAATGASLDMKRLSVYPVTHTQLFLLEVLLRLTTGLETIIVLTGASGGLFLNPAVPAWAPLGFLPFIAMNLLLSAGIRDLLGRLLARKRIREIAVFALVLVMALPQLLVMTGIGRDAREWLPRLVFHWWPWSVTARLASATGGWADWAAMLAWTALAFAFGKWQFDRGFRFDVDAVRAADAPSSRSAGWAEHIYRLPSLLFPDPLGALVEKELRFLSRAPRFRLLFLMGFSFGLIVWLPLAFRSGFSEDSVMANNYLTFVTVYALMLLGEVTFWNTFGFDRSAAQLYWVAPVPLPLVLIAKNIASASFILLEVTVVALVCMALRLPVTLGRLTEAYAVTIVLALYLMAIGNLASTYYPRPVNPAHSWRSGAAGRFQALLLLIYPVVSIPIALAYLARYAFDSQAAFYAVLAFGAALGVIVYGVAMESAVSTAMDRREKLVTALSQGEGPVSA